MATKCRPARFPSVAVMRCQKKRSIEATSTVPPLLLATRNKRLPRLETRGRARDRAFVGRIEHEEIRRALGDAEDRTHDFGAQAAAAHAEQVDGANALALRGLAERGHAVDFGCGCSGDVEPAQPRFDRAGVGAARSRAPDADVAIPDSSDDMVMDEGVGKAGAGLKMKRHGSRTAGLLSRSGQEEARTRGCRHVQYCAGESPETS